LIDGGVLCVVVRSLVFQANKFAELAKQAVGAIEATPNVDEGAKKSVKIK
jgi:hypothetical protein